MEAPHFTSITYNTFYMCQKVIAKSLYKYWFKILKTENCILKNCYENMLESSAFKPNDKLNWGCKIRDIFIL
jgi:hypothetical protein